MNSFIFVDDIFRQEISEARFCIYKTLQALFKRAFDSEIVAPRFSATNIFSPLMKKHADIDWTSVYFSLPEEIEKEYISLLDKNAIYISYEAPLWLFKIWKQHNIKYIDLRLSYLRFLPDIPVMISTNIPSMISVLEQFILQEKDITLEADLCQASYHFRHFRDWHNLRRFENSLIFIGQTPSDTSLMKEGYARVITIEDYESVLRKMLSQYQKIFYKPHPFTTPQHQAKEIAFLNRISGQKIQTIQANIYNLFSQDFPIDFVGLSSGALKEAYFFGKKSFMLMDYPFEYHKTKKDINYANISSYYFFSPLFWQKCLKDEVSIKSPCSQYRDPHANLMREHHNASWGFNQFYYENRLSTYDLLTAWGTISSKVFTPQNINILNNKFMDFNNVTQNIKKIANFPRIRRNYYRCKVLSKITWGKTQQYYRQQSDILHQQVRQIREFLKK